MFICAFSTNIVMRPVIATAYSAVLPSVCGECFAGGGRSAESYALWGDNAPRPTCIGDCDRNNIYSSVLVRALNNAMEPKESGIVASVAESIGTCPDSLRLIVSLLAGLCHFDVSFSVSTVTIDWLCHSLTHCMCIPTVATGSACCLGKTVRGQGDRRHE